MPDFINLNLSFLDNLPVSPEAALVIGALVISLLAGVFALIANRRALAASSEDTATDMGVIFDNPASILPHVIELRNRLINSFIALIIGTVVATMLSDEILALAAAPLGPDGLANLQAIRVTEPFGVFFRVALTVGAILAAPYIISQLWIFIAAGLKPSEQRVFYLTVPFAVILFLTGVTFAYVVMLPVAVPFLTNFMGMNAHPTIDNYISFITTVLLWVGISFEMPLVIFGLAKLGIVNAGMLARNWRIAVVVIVIAAAFITPTPDPVNMMIVAAPLMVLYLLSIVLAMFA
ncbi:MAG TPA: twin-arginine translocase subunit TatC [Aggregatilineales bacterium]|nr:twin-arginine translocase subunit TatC [Aggregatilineales bacterium]HPV06500.1 twin-arginine translocase subunit TatC [Aggregatilineales bacterium]HQA68469.1 twin-arginine translocase subunit TatC [Aggregatilineales bacterium]HQE18278.1 twin-arginine translocase subunit TatC [Aggregatilineales bacterium]